MRFISGLAVAGLTTLVAAAPATAAGSCRPGVSAATDAAAGAPLTLSYKACARGSYRFRLISLSTDHALRGVVRARRTIQAAPGLRELSLPAPGITGPYAVSMEIPSGRRLRASHVLHVGRRLPGPSGPPCTAGRTLQRTSESRLFAVGDRLYACLGAQQRAWTVGDAEEDACFPDHCEFGPMALAGPWLAYGAANSGRHGSQFQAVRMDLRTGRKVDRIDAGPLTEQQQLDSQQGVNAGRGPLTDLVLKANGSLALMYDDRYEPGNHGVVLDDQDGTRNVTSAADIRPGTLRISGEDQVSWTQGNEQRNESLR